jgi:hypothetical protein
VAVAHRVRSHRQAPGAASSAPSVTQGRCAARPRFKSSAIRARCAALGSIPCVPSEVIPLRRTSSVRAYPNTMLRALSGLFLWVTFILLRASCPPPFGPASPFACAPAHAWASKRKVTRSAAADRNARRVGGTLAAT